LYDTDSLSAGASYYVNDNISVSIDGNHEKKKSDYITYASISDYDYNSAKATLEYEDDDMNVVSGADIFDGVRNSHANSYAPANITTKKNLALFLMTNYTFNKNSIKAGYRYEKVFYEYKDATKLNKSDHSLSGAELGYNYMLDKKSSVFVNYAHGYQAPDIDRFFSYGTFNNFINPMKTDSYTVGYNNIANTNKLKISLYYINLKNEIYYYSDPAYASSKNTNIDKSHKYGLDLYDKYIINKEFNIALNYNYVQAIIDNEEQNGEDYSGNKLPGVSEHNVKAAASYFPNKNAVLSLSHVYRSQAYAADDFNNDFAQKQDAFGSTNLSFAYAKNNWEVFAKINNLFNQKNGLWIKDDAVYPINFTTTGLVGFKLKY